MSEKVLPKLAHHSARVTPTETPIEMESLKLRLLRPEHMTADYLGPHLRAIITNQREHPVGIRRAHLVGNSTQTSIPWVSTAPASIDAGESVDRSITLTWLTLRRLRRDSALVLEVECDDGERVRSGEVGITDTQTWTPAEEVKATVGVLLVGILWWFIPWVPLLDLPRAPQIVAWALCAAGTAWLCSGFYARLWRGQATWGTGLVLGPQRRVRPLTDVLLTSLGVWFVLTAPFAFATYLIDAQQLGVGVDGTPFNRAENRYFEAIGLYAWHAIDVLPFVEATDTLNWTEPLRDYSQTTGALLLLYKGLVLAPVVAAARAAWRGRTPREPRDQERPRASAQQPPENVPPEATPDAAELPGARRSGT